MHNFTAQGISERANGSTKLGLLLVHYEHALHGLIKNKERVFMLSDWSKKVLGVAAVLGVALVLYPPKQACGVKQEYRCWSDGHKFIWAMGFNARGHGDGDALDSPRLLTLLAGVGFAAAAAIFLRK